MCLLPIVNSKSRAYSIVSFIIFVSALKHHQTRLFRVTKSFTSQYIRSYNINKCIHIFYKPLGSFNRNLLIRQFSTMSEVNPQDNSENKQLFDKSIFDESIQLVALKIPKHLCNEFTRILKKYLFERPRTRRIYDCEDDADKRYLLLSEKITSLSIEGIPEDIQSRLKALCSPIVTSYYNLKIGYASMSVDEALRRLLPSTIQDIPSSFEQIGHIAHFNLREETLPYKELIGQVILDKHSPRITTVVNKTGQIEAEFRTFPMEVIAGENNTIVVLKESNAKFTFNFRDVYWNSRLQAEHDRVIDNIVSSSKNGGVVADIMAGVGPFAVPIAMSKQIQVHANDLNPSSYEYLVQNGKANHCGRQLTCYNMDGRDFVIELAEKNIPISEAIMNLPQNAYEFVDVFIGYYRRYTNPPKILPRIHCYAFSTDDDPIYDVMSRVAAVLQCDVSCMNYDALPSASDAKKPIFRSRNVCFGHIVRDVAPRKVMVCLTFQLPEKVANADIFIQRSNRVYPVRGIETEPSHKKRKIN